jgi:hypothetical protein
MLIPLTIDQRQHRISATAGCQLRQRYGDGVNPQSGAIVWSPSAPPSKCGWGRLIRMATAQSGCHR